MNKHPQTRAERRRISKELKYIQPTHAKRRARLEAEEKEAEDELHGEFLETDE